MQKSAKYHRKLRKELIARNKLDQKINRLRNDIHILIGKLNQMEDDRLSNKQIAEKVGCFANQVSMHANFTRL